MVTFVQDPHGKNEVVTFPEDFDGRIATDIATSETVNCIDNIFVKDLTKLQVGALIGVLMEQEEVKLTTIFY